MEVGGERKGQMEVGGERGGRGRNGGRWSGGKGAVREGIWKEIAHNSSPCSAPNRVHCVRGCTHSQTYH